MRMKKLLTVTLVLVFASALVFAFGCAKKEQASMESGGEQSMEQSATPPAQTGMTDSTGAMMTSPDTTKAAGN